MIFSSLAGIVGIQWDFSWKIKTPVWLL